MAAPKDGTQKDPKAAAKKTPAARHFWKLKFEGDRSKMRIAVSACLLGENCKYNGG
jgi:hypothetical protein